MFVVRILSLTHWAVADQPTDWQNSLEIVMSMCGIMVLSSLRWVIWNAYSFPSINRWHKQKCQSLLIFSAQTDDDDADDDDKKTSKIYLLNIHKYHCCCCVFLLYALAMFSQFVSSSAQFGNWTHHTPNHHLYDWNRNRNRDVCIAATTAGKKTAPTEK